MLIVFYTNCQGKFIYDNYLSTLDFFRSNTVHIILNYLTKREDINDDLLQTCDIFIYQPMHGYTVHASGRNDMISFLKPSCIKICFPCIYADMWPMYDENGKYCGAGAIIPYRERGLSLEQILYLYNTGEFYFGMQERFNKSIAYLIEKEKDHCNIKVSDFILANYKQHRLFDTQNHPNGVLGAYVAIEICKLLNITPSIVDVFSQKMTHISPMRWQDSLYMRRELGLEYIEADEGNAMYLEMLIKVYNNPQLIKYKYL